MARLPKAIIKKYGITKKAWQVFRGTHSTKRVVKPMAKRRFARRWRGRARRRFSKAKVPFEVLIGAVSIPFTHCQEGVMTPMQAIERGNLEELMLHLKSGFLGIDVWSQKFDPMAALNPFDMEHAKYTKMLIYAGLIGMIRRKFTGKYTAPLFKKIPLIGRFVN